MTLETSPDHGDVVSLLEPLDVGLEPALASLQARLARDAQLTHALDIAYRVVDSPVGKLLLAATDRGILRVAFEGENHDDVLQYLANRVSPRILRAPARLDDAARQLEEYFGGARREFDLILDFRLSRGFRLSVLQHLPRIAYGHTESYAEVALAAGSPNAVRAVGTACATNPLPVIVPCHRVVKSDGSFGGYLGGPEAKRALLTLEAAA
ncbi:methylated-DNA--[protein]-cysteine S-methyltransferase [Paenarthrobacter aurescens]|uniref:methylated-DNA--[protein]-cysteine S-methyltransferase n=1 Tax=Paenarthrobacter aurescens TaxID=43663 RepID=UPI0021BE4EC8|nr:methylated-DNA--[protein]-cysteine S-methyltransferase [Paenarthrobacter aurescens]MCT9869545.1 methylated-DNA--[protein]-cysteine S-methyltransferase [Paenarthrobacter aurescens]